MQPEIVILHYHFPLTNLCRCSQMLIASDSSRKRIYSFYSTFKSNPGFLIYLSVYFEVFIVSFAIVKEFETQKIFNDSWKTENGHSWKCPVLVCVWIFFFFLRTIILRRTEQ